MQTTSTGLTTSRGFKGSTRWCSPEILLGETKTLKSDIWGWGCLALEIMTDQIPYHETKLDNMVIVLLCVEGSRRKSPEPSDPPNLPNNLMHLLRKCWEFSPDLRPDVGSCVNWLRPLKSAAWLNNAIMEYIRIFEDVLDGWIADAWNNWTVARVLFQVSYLTWNELRHDIAFTQGQLRNLATHQGSNSKLKGYLQLRVQVLNKELQNRSNKFSLAERRQSSGIRDPAGQLLQTFSTLRRPVRLTKNQVRDKLKEISVHLKPFLVLLDQRSRLSFPLSAFELLVRHYPDDSHPTVEKWLIDVKYDRHLQHGEYHLSFDVAMHAVDRLRSPSKTDNKLLPELASALEKAATSCEMLGQYEKACLLLRDAVHVNRTLGTGGTKQAHIPLARTLWSYHRNLCRLGRGSIERGSVDLLREASRIYNSAVAFERDGLEKFGRDLAGVMEDLCLTLRRQGQIALASEEEARLSRVYERLDLAT